MNDAAVMISATRSQGAVTRAVMLATAALICGIRPATAARLTLAVSLRTAAAIHVLCALAAAFSLIALDAGMDGVPLAAPFADIAREFARDPNTAVLWGLGIALLIEAGFLWLAFLMAPWGAVQEPLRASFSHALRRTWCQTPHIALIIVLVGLLTARLDYLDDHWVAIHPVTYPPMPSGPAAPYVAGNPPSLQPYFDEVRRIDRAARMAKPWYLRYDEAIAVDLGFLCGVWFLGSMLRAVGVSRAAPPMPRQPRCDACGYDLTTMSLESRCPECGEPVAVSLGPDARPGPPWQRRTTSALSAWWYSAYAAVFQPTKLGRSLQLQSPGTAHRRFLLLHMPIIFLIAAASLPTLYYVLEGHSPFPKDADLVWIGSPVFGTLCMAGALAVALGTASRCGVLHAVRDKRNLLTGAVQVVSYLMVFLVFWEMIGAATAIAALKLARIPTYQAWCTLKRIDPDLSAFFLWIVPNLVLAVIYWRLARMAVAATRHANR